MQADFARSKREKSQLVFRVSKGWMRRKRKREKEREREREPGCGTVVVLVNVEMWKCENMRVTAKVKAGGSHRVQIGS